MQPHDDFNDWTPGHIYLFGCMLCTSLLVVTTTVTTTIINNNITNEPVQYFFNQYNIWMLHNAKVIKTVAWQ